MIQRAHELLGKIGVRMDVLQTMRELTTAQEQVVQIAAAIGTGANILVFDEPTASLSEREARQLFALIEDLKRRGVTMIYVSHRMPEVFRAVQCDQRFARWAVCGDVAAGGGTKRVAGGDTE